MPNYKNQKIIKVNIDKIIHKEGDKTHTFLRPINWDPLMMAMGILSGNEFKIYLYLYKWSGGEQKYDFSPADIYIKLGISEDTARKAFKTLTNLKFLIQESNLRYQFDPMPNNIKTLYLNKLAERGLKDKNFLDEPI